ncbi:uncharacterized protein EpC_18180 [Erwinia pyrifoliae Ep1/96]|nr:uncharacterized protein EpC_18180 [Erwinia pyrifoliae Ep1/96]
MIYTFWLLHICWPSRGGIVSMMQIREPHLLQRHYFCAVMGFFFGFLQAMKSWLSQQRRGAWMYGILLKH